MLMSRSNRSTLPLLLGGLALALVIGSCTEDAAGPSPREAPAFKRGDGPGGGPGKDADPVVAATDPDSASQDTTIDVLVIGEGFDEGSTAEWLIDEAPDPLNRIRTNRTTYVNPKRLIANITIAADAETTLYDVEVQTSKGRKGVGIEVFRVKLKTEPIPVEATLRDDAGDGVWSDGGGTYVAEIDENGNLFLDARVATERQICLDFAGQAGAPSPDAFCDAAWISTFDPYENGGLQTATTGGSRSDGTARRANWCRTSSPWRRPRARTRGRSRPGTPRSAAPRRRGSRARSTSGASPFPFTCSWCAPPRPDPCVARRVARSRGRAHPSVGREPRAPTRRAADFREPPGLRVSPLPPPPNLQLAQIPDVPPCHE
jgi:hypothetical protein